MATLNLGMANNLLRTVYLPKMIDTITQANPLFLMLKQKSETFDGGETFSQPIMYGEYADGEGGWFGADDDTLASEGGDDAAAPFWSWVATNQPIRLHMIEDAKFANTQAAAANLVGIRSESASMKLADRFGDALYAPVGHSVKQILSLPDMFDDTITYGGIDRAAAGNDFWKAKHVYAGTAGTATAITIDKVTEAIEEATQGSIRPDFGITDHNMWRRIKSLQQAKTTWNADSAELKVGGYTGVKVDGVPIFWDSHADNGGLDGSNKTLRRIRFLNLNYIHMLAHRDYQFSLRDFDWLAADSPVMLAQMFWFGQFYTDNPRYQSELLDCLDTA